MFKLSPFEKKLFKASSGLMIFGCLGTIFLTIPILIIVFFLFFI